MKDIFQRSLAATTDLFLMLPCSGLISYLQSHTAFDLLGNYTYHLQGKPKESKKILLHLLLPCSKTCHMALNPADYIQSSLHRLGDSFIAL